jgi:quercetin dioxygenase-like cupin family protein
MSELHSQVFNMAELIAVQTGAVVSRTLVNKKTGTLTVFAFDAGEGLSEHTAPFDALVYILEGEAEVTIGGTPLHLQSGEMVIMPADIPHALQAHTPFKMLLVMIR